MFLARSSWRPIVKTLNLNVWALPLIFLHEYTLFVIDMHQNRSISTLLTPFDHFQKRVFGRLISWHHLRPCRMEFYFLQRPKVTQEVKETWNPLLVPLQLNTGGKQAFQKTSRCLSQVWVEVKISEAPSGRPYPPHPHHYGIPFCKKCFGSKKLGPKIVVKDFYAELDHLEKIIQLWTICFGPATRRQHFSLNWTMLRK